MLISIEPTELYPALWGQAIVQWTAAVGPSYVYVNGTLAVEIDGAGLQSAVIPGEPKRFFALEVHEGENVLPIYPEGNCSERVLRWPAIDGADHYDIFTKLDQGDYVYLGNEIHNPDDPLVTHTIMDAFYCPNAKFLMVRVEAISRRGVSLAALYFTISLHEYNMKAIQNIEVLGDSGTLTIDLEPFAN